MMRDLSLGTAGHIDHGKTALVKALTGTDCHRLPDEKRRGITIDIGFARLDLGDYRVGIVDVPGHERFVRNMLAGATGIDLAVLVVAADDSVMPQTREHLEILRLLGLRHGLVALTKCDLVDETTREVVELEIRELVKGSFLENAPIVRTSASTGEGVPQLKAAIAEECRRIGARGLAQVFLEEPATATWGQPFVVRGPSATQTLGGGQVLQPVARKVRRRHLDVLERVEKLWTGDAEQRALTVAWFGGFSGFTPADLVRGANLGPQEAEQMIATLKERGDLAEIVTGHARRLLLHADLLKDLDERILQVLARLHEQSPLMTSHDRHKVQSHLDYIGDEALVHAAVDRLLKQKRLVGDLRRIARADYKPKLSANLRKLKDKVVAAYQEAAFQPPEPASFANQAGGNAASLADLFDVCVAEGYLVQVAPDIYLHADAEAQMRQRVRDKLAGGGPGVTVAEIRDLLGTTRKYAVPFCEYLDRIGLTKREGDLRVLASGAA